MNIEPSLKNKTDLTIHDSENFDLKNFFRLSAGTLSFLFGGFWLWASILAFSFDSASILILISGGILPSVGGLLLLLKKPKRKVKTLEDVLHEAFYELLESKNGYITDLDLAMKTRSNARDARNFLQQKAKDFNANFVVSEEGEVAYKFKYLTHSEVQALKEKD